MDALQTYVVIAGRLVCGVACLAAVAPAQASSGGSVFCKYSYYGTEHRQCRSEPLDEAKQACEQEASERHGEKIVCWCTDDPNYMRDVCDEP